MDFPDNVLKRILQLHCSETRRQGDIRLVNKRLSLVALEVIFHTISVKTFDGLLRLLSVPLSPLYLERLGKHVHCFELGFFLQDYQLVGVHYDIPLALPNLDSVRFRFTHGVPIDAGANMHALLCEDTMGRALRAASDHSWLRFLSEFNPRKFEWISDEAHTLHLVGLYAELRFLLDRSWNSLTSVFLEGICFVEQSGLDTWAPTFLAERVHIRGAPIANTSFLRGISRAHGSTRCRYLLLEAMGVEEGAQVSLQEPATPSLVFGPMLVAVKGWNADTCRKFVKHLTEEVQATRVEANELKSKQNWFKRGEPIPLDLLWLLIFFSLLFAMVTRRWGLPALYGESLYSKLAPHLKLSCTGNRRYNENQIYKDISFNIQLFGVRLPPFEPMWRSRAAVRSFNFVPT